MKRLKRLFNLTMALIMLVTICVSNIGASASEHYVPPLFENDKNTVYFSENDFSGFIDSEISAAVILDIKAGTKVFNIPETIVCNGTTYPVKHLYIFWAVYGCSSFNKSIETINISKNIETIFCDLSISSEYSDTFDTLKTVNVPAGSKLKSIVLPTCPKLEKINIPSNSALKYISIGGCPILKKLSLPKTLETCIINSCPKLTKLSLPKTLKNCDIGYDAPKLKVKIAKGNKYLKVKGNQILSKDGKKLINIIGNKSKVTVYKTVKVIGDFENKYLKQLTIGENVTNFSKDFLNTSKKLNIVLKHKNKAPKIKKYSIWQYDIKGINFYVQNKKVAKDLKKKLKVGGIEKAKILIGKKVIYKIENY